MAVPFLGRNAVSQLPLRRGDVLVTRFDEETVRQGLVAPRAVVEFIRRGVEVHAVANLHAKVFVFGRVAVVGSANISNLSEQRLVEAACELTQPELVESCRAFVRSLRGEVVEIEFARRLIRYYRPPRGPFGELSSQRKRRTVSRRVHQSDLVAVSLTSTNYDEADELAAASAQKAARAILRSPDRFRLEDFRWTGQTPPVLRRYVRVLRCTRNGRRTEIAAPARILQIRRYKSARGTVRSIVVVEVRKYVREKSLSDVQRVLGVKARTLRNVRGARTLRNSALVYGLGQMWPLT